MRKSSLVAVITALCIIYLCPCLLSCGNSAKNVSEQSAETTESAPSKQPLNVSIMLDLSDRILKQSDGMNQVEKDLAIVGYIRDFLLEDVTKKKILKADCRLKVYFYPTPVIADINNIAQDLEYDFSTCAKTGKKQLALNMRDSLIPKLKKIYDKTVQTQNWVGSDIYGFMQSKATKYCIKKGYRNVLFILTDGYIYHVNNWGNEGKCYKGITSQSLNAGQTGIVSTGIKLPDLDVVFLEVNATNAETATKIQRLISDWLIDMNISQYGVETTDLPTNTKIFINSFLE